MYPLIIEKSGIQFLAYPFDVIEEGEGVIPVPDIIDETHKEGVKGYVILRYMNKHSQLKKYVINDHFVFAGCEEEDIQCDHKSIFEVWHPKDEWEKHHIIGH